MTIRDTIIFTVGAAIGAASTYFILKDKIEKQINEEVENAKSYYKELYSNKEETPSEEIEPEEKVLEFVEKEEVKEKEEPNYDDIINKLNYNQYSTKVPDQYGEPRPAKKPYIISEDEYNTDVRQAKKIISYFEDDGVCLDNDTKEVLDNVAKDLGIDNLEMVNEEGYEELYIRNEVTGIDYNIVSEPGSYEDYLEGGDD